MKLQLSLTTRLEIFSRVTQVQALSMCPSREPAITPRHATRQSEFKSNAPPHLSFCISPTYFILLILDQRELKHSIESVYRP